MQAQRAEGGIGSSNLETARAALHEHFGYPAFRPGQEAAVESVLGGRDTLVVLPTGGGKSLCYQVPALILPKLTVVISPLISLMKDQVDALESRGLPATFVNSTLTSSQVADRLSRAMRGDVKMLYVAPERFDFGTTAERLRDAGVSLLAVDEAHCISEWGHDFRPSYLRIASVREKLGWPPTVALTATATPHVRTDIVTQLKLDSPTTIITGFDRKNLSYHVLPTKTDQDKDDALVHLLKANDGLAVVYASTRKAVERIAALLDRSRIPAAAYHAGLDDAKRHAVQESFMTEKVRAIVATNAFGMGIDKPNVRLVLHYAMPGTLEAYYQEAGRAGRDGDRATCYLLHAFPDRFTHEFFIKGAYPERARRHRVPAEGQGRRARRRVGAPYSDTGQGLRGESGAGKPRARSSPRDAGANQARVRRQQFARARPFARPVARGGRRAQRWRIDRPGRTAAGIWPGVGRSAVIGSIGGSTVHPVAAMRRGRGTYLAEKTAHGVPDRLGRDRAAPQGRSPEARRDAAVRVHEGMPPWIRAAVLRRSRGPSLVRGV